MKKIDISETELTGSIILDGKTVKKDDVFMRINWLRNNYLKEIAVDESGWEVLYQDPNDSRYWELTFPDSESHGGGAPKLSYVKLSETIKSKYKI